jgi:hypothetical protein
MNECNAQMMMLYSFRGWVKGMVIFGAVLSLACLLEARPIGFGGAPGLGGIRPIGPNSSFISAGYNRPYQSVGGNMSNPPNQPGSGSMSNRPNQTGAGNMSNPPGGGNGNYGAYQPRGGNVPKGPGPPVSVSNQIGQKFDSFRQTDYTGRFQYSNWGSRSEQIPSMGPGGTVHMNTVPRNALGWRPDSGGNQKMQHPSPLSPQRNSNNGNGLMYPALNNVEFTRKRT